VTGTNVNGCTAVSNTVTATINPLPIVGAIGTTSICFGDTTLISALGAQTYIWSNGLSGDSINVSPSLTTTYSVVGTDVNGCSGVDTVDVIVNPNPTVEAEASLGSICFGTSDTLSVTGADIYSWDNGSSNALIFVSPLVTTDYIVTGMTVFGCIGIDTVSVVVKPNPVISISASINPICVGTSSVLTAGGADTYVWSNSLGSINPVTVSPSSTTTYFVTGTTSGCTGIDFITVNVNPIPNVSIITLQDSICEGSNSHLTASGATSYVWSNGLGAGSSKTVSPLVTTMYTVTGTNNFLCSSSASVLIYVDPMPHVTTGGDQIICEGSGGVYISASGANSYLWSPAGSLSNAFISTPFAFPGTTTLFTVTGISGLCADTNFVLVEVISNPVIDSVYYNAGSGTLYLHDNNGGLSNLAFIKIGTSSVMYLPFALEGDTVAWFSGITLMNGEGIYVENTSGCSTYFIYDATSGISSETELPNSLEVYPNPFSDVLYVTLPNDGNGYEVSLFNMNGQFVRSEFVNGSFELQRDGLSSGIYFLKAISSEKTYSTKVEVR
jgi:hypothetical protein